MTGWSDGALCDRKSLLDLQEFKNTFLDTHRHKVFVYLSDAWLVVHPRGAGRAGRRRTPVLVLSPSP